MDLTKTNEKVANKGKKNRDADKAGISMPGKEMGTGMDEAAGQEGAAAAATTTHTAHVSASESAALVGGLAGTTRDKAADESTFEEIIHTATADDGLTDDDEDQLKKRDTAEEDPAKPEERNKTVGGEEGNACGGWQEAFAKLQDRLEEFSLERGKIEGEVRDMKEQLDRYARKNERLENELRELKNQLKSPSAGESEIKLQLSEIRKDIQTEMLKIKMSADITNQNLYKLKSDLRIIEKDKENNVLSEISEGTLDSEITKKGENDDRMSIADMDTGAEGEREVGKENGQDSNNNIRVRTESEYLKNIPDTLSRQELTKERAERQARKKNIFIRGIRTVGAGIKEEIASIIKEKMGVIISIERIRAIGGGLVLELESRENKIKVMKNKKYLKGIDIWLDDDYTEREKEIQGWLEEVAEEEKKYGIETRVGYQKIKVKEQWYVWDEAEGRLEEQDNRTFRQE